MLMNLNEVTKLIEEGRLLHIAGSEDALRKLPKGNWMGGSTEYFMSDLEGGKISADELFVRELNAKNFSIKAYDVSNISQVATDAYDNGFSLVVVPFDSEVHKYYAEHAAEFEDMFMKQIAGWVAGYNLNKADACAITVDGTSLSFFKDKAMAMHIEVEADKNVTLNIINIFEQDDKAPLIEFKEEGFSVKIAIVDGKEVNFAKYLEENKIDTKLPLVGEYAGNGINVSIKDIEDGVVQLYAPVFSGIEYRFAKAIPDYEKEFHDKLAEHQESEIFACNCILNFLYGDLEGKKLEKFEGPITFGEIAYQLVNQTLVYLVVE